jgi:hypothetical protein
MPQEADRERYLRRGLVQALRKERYGRLCRNEPSDLTHIATILSHGLTWSMVVALAFWLFIRIEISVWQAMGVVAAFLFVLGVFAAITKRFGAAALIIVIFWVVTGLQSYSEAGIGGAAATHLLPFALVALAVWMWRALALASTIPFLLPVALVIVFLPLLTQDLWVVGDEIGFQLLAVGAVALGPLLTVLAVRYSRIDVESQLLTSLEEIRKSADLRNELLTAIKAAPRESAEEAPSDDWMWSRVANVYDGEDSMADIRAIGKDLKRTFRRQTIFRLMRLAIGIGALFGAFIYLLAWAAIPASTSSRWIGHDVDMTSIEFAGWAFALPTTQYISVAILLSIVAAAAFIAFALTEDRYSSALSDVLVRKPASRCGLLGLPYHELYGDSESR